MRSQDSVFNLVESLKEKLEWVTPKISLMVARDAEGKNAQYPNEGLPSTGASDGPS
jgi:hypothetical protein